MAGVVECLSDRCRVVVVVAEVLGVSRHVRQSLPGLPARALV